MKSAQHGTSTSAIEVVNVGRDGFWLWLDGEELYLPFDRFPWFRTASIAQLFEVERPSPHHLRWPSLDVDLATESIVHPDQYPLESRVRPNNALQRTRSRAKASRARPRVSRRAARR